MLSISYQSQKFPHYRVPLNIEVTPQLTIKRVMVPPVFAELIRKTPQMAKAGVWSGLDYNEVLNSTVGQQMKQFMLDAIFVQLVAQQRENLIAQAWAKPPVLTPAYKHQKQAIENDQVDWHAETHAIREVALKTVEQLRGAIVFSILFKEILNFLGLGQYFKLPLGQNDEGQLDYQPPSPFDMKPKLTA